ncbi:ABC transporter permease [Ideonella azotifigens]|uniref:ABC transporter permease n=1 Tax=Ideonella azotifigens TaxID=513160 RepID=UPI001E2E26FD|nr:ABC transporter permease [Ideonella azotifigens]MCD2338907.1 ABC transporter permease [Ideonella azotifigens]
MVHAASASASRREQTLRWLLPLLAVLLFLGGWEAAVAWWEIPPYLLPAPSRVLVTLWDNLGSLMVSWWVTLRITLMALALACVGGVGVAAVFALSRWVEWSLTPFAVVLQVTPVIAVAPLIMILTDSATATVLICAFIVAFFPLLANTLTGLRSADAGLRELFRLYHASRWQTLRFLLVPSALPYFLSGLKIAGGLSLIGAVVAEFTAGAAGRNTGLASRILEAAFRTEIPKMFAALLLVSATGVLIHAFFEWLSRRLLRGWHDSERGR